MGSTLGKGESPSTEGQGQRGKGHTLFLFWVGDRACSEKLAKKKAILLEAGILFIERATKAAFSEREGEKTNIFTFLKVKKDSRERDNAICFPFLRKDTLK